MKNFISLILLLIVFQAVNATNYYVSVAGNDSDNGKSMDQSWKTIQKAADEMNPGDTCFVADGSYVEEVKINRSGVENGNITFKVINKWGAKITNSWANCFTIKASFIRIDGFDLKAPSMYGSGIAVMPSDNGTFHHHIIVINNNCHDSGQSGISFWDCDYITIENNVCSKNAWLMPYCGSGISIYGRYTYDTNPGFHYIVRGNICYLNDNGPSTALTDGNGIIIDDLRNTQSGSHHGLAQSLSYTTQAVLLENNLCYANGGKGIQLCWSNNITVRNNTLYGNCTRKDQQGTWNADLSCNFVSNLIVANNICVSTVPNSEAHGLFIGAGSGIGVSSNLKFYNNLTYSTFNPASISFGTYAYIITVAGANNNLCGSKPLFADENKNNFRLLTGSPAINTGTLDKGVANVDLDGNTRVIGPSVDLGCYEYQDLTTGLNEKSSEMIPFQIQTIFPEVIISNLSEKPFKASVYDIRGTLIANSIIATSEKINLATCGTGAYLIRICGKDYNFTRKILLVRN